MKKFINSVDDLVQDSAAGLVMAHEDLLEMECATVLVNDDVAVEHSTHTTGRRGVAGTLIVEKMIGAAAEAGADLYECKALGARVNASTASMGVALSSCIVPDADAPTFDIGGAEMEVGVGIHGEPGRYRRSLLPADDIVALLLEPVLKDLSLAAGRPVLL